MNIKIILLLIISITQIGICAAQHHRNEKETQGLINSVEKSMIKFLHKIPDHLLVNYGINDTKEINKASIGNPVNVYNILNDTLVFTDTWRVPLVIDNEYRALFTVIKDSISEYRIVDFGATFLAKAIFKANKIYRTKALLRVYKLRKDFIICDTNKGGYEFVPIQDLKSKKITLSDIIDLSNN